MDEKYLQELYRWIGQNDASFGSDVPYEQFKQKMNDPSYAEKMHGWIGSIDKTFTQDLPLGDFINKTKGELSDVKKKSIRQEDMVSPLPTISSDLPSRNKPTQDNTFIQKPIIMQSQEEVAVQKEENVRFNKLAAENKRKEEDADVPISTAWENVGSNLIVGINALDKMVASLPEAVYDLVALPQNLVAYATGWDIATNAEKFKKDMGISNPILDMLKEEEKGLQKHIATYNKANYESTGIAENIGKGNYGDAFELLGNNILQSVPVSLAMMYGGATLKASELVTIGTVGFLEQNRSSLDEENPDMPEIEKTIKALGMASAETVFSAIGTGTIGSVYRDIIKKEGVEAGGQIFKDGLIHSYKTALRKYGVPVGVLGESIEEVATQVTQNVFSGKPAFEGAADAFITGGGMGVMFTAPITAVNAKKQISNTIETYQSKSKISDILKDSPLDLEQVFNVPKDDAITIEQLDITNTNKSRDIIEKNLKKQVKSGAITKEDAQQSLYVFDRVQQISNAIKDVEVNNSEKAEIANLLRRRFDLKAKTENQDDVLVVKEKQEIEQINQRISDIILNSKTEQDAIQKQTTDEGVLGSQQPQVGLQEVGKGDTQPEGVATGTEEVAAKSGTQEITREDDVHKAAKDKGIITDSEDPNVSAAFMKKSKEVADKDNPQGHLDKMSPTQLGEMMEYIKALPTQEVKDKVVGSGVGGDVVVERFENDGRLGEYYAPKGEGYEGYGKNKKVSVISKDANVVELDNSERYLISKGEKIADESVAKKLGTNSWAEAFEKMNTEDLSNSEITDIEKYTKVLYREAQLAVKDFVLKENPKTDVIKFKMEDEVNPTQYWVLDKNVLIYKPKSVPQEVASMEKQFGKEFPTTPTADKGVSVTNKSAIDNIKTKTTDKGRIRVIESAQRVLKTLKSVLPNFDIVLHDDEGSFNAAMDGIGATQGTRGNFAINKDGSGRIDINLSRANSRTVAHEVAHAIMARAFGENPALFEGFRDKISKVLNESANKKLMDFANNYAGDVTYEEYLAELTAMLSQEETNLSVNTLQKIAAIINEIVSKITNGTFKPFEDIKDTKQIVDFFKSISESIRKGEEIDVSGMGAVKIAKSQSKSQINTNKDEKQQGTTGPVAGNRLFNKPIKAVSEIADRYYKRVFNSERPRFAGTRRLDESRGKRISDAFVAMKDDSNNPEVKSAYKVLAKETLDQYKEFLDAGYIVEINDNEPYGNSQEMINDLRNNKRIKIFSTEAGFGKNKITKKQREDNPLLTKTDFKDVNGQPLLVNDVFRAIHDFFGHAELGNSFGAIGEENAWNVHARMFSPLARRAMTTETRGQNSYVNFSGVNEKIEVLREEARKLREQGNEAGAQLVVNKIYEEGFFADQKIGLLPNEFSQFDKQDMGDISMRPEGLQERDQEKPKSKSQVIGANANLTATARVNLVLAKELHSQKVKPIDIRMQTGWEMGKDGKWRYEIMPGKFKDIDLDDLKRRMTGIGTYARIGKLGDIFDSPELYDRYPDARGITVVFKRMPKDERGSFNTATNDISINEKLYRDTKSVAELTMLHEIQHYVQKVEAFEQGSNTAMAIVLMRTMKKFSADKVKEVKGLYNKIKKDFPADKKAINGAKELMDFTVKKYEILQNLSIHKDTKDDKKSAATIKKELATAYNLYLRVAGEVEARNIGYRRGLTMEQRRRTLLSETENIDIEDQILFENEGELYAEMEKNFPISKSQLDATNVINKIIKDARAQGFSEESIRVFLEGKGISAAAVKLAMQTETGAATRIKISEELLEGYTNLMGKIDAFIAKGRSDADVISLLKNSQDYIGATDVQKEILVREVRKKLELKQRSAPLADRLLGAIKNITKITMTEKQALIKQIKDLGRGAKDAKKAIAEATKQLSKEIKALVTEGKLTLNQAANVVRAFSKVNVLSQTSVDRFTDYMTKVFANAEYASKLTTAKSLRRDISKLSKNKDKNANLRDLAQQFAKINPSMVEDIDAYNDMASKIKEATKGSTIRLEKVTFAETVNIENASKYINETIKAQDEMIRQERIAEIQDLMGIDASEFSAEDMLDLLEDKKPITKYNEGIVREAINKMFNIYSTLINNTIREGRDPFTDEEVNFTNAQKDVIKRFMAMDLSLLSPKEALQAVDALANFLQNSSTARMESVLSKYTANFNLKKLINKGIVAQPLKKYWSEKFGRFLGEQTTNLNILFEKMFKGFNRGGEVEDAMGVTKLKNNKSMGERKSNNIVDEYVSQFYKRKANGEAYNTEYNSVERGLSAFMIRNVIGTAKQMEAEFNRRKELIKESIKVLFTGNDQEQKKSELYQKVYDKILKNSNSIQDIKDNTDITNLEGIDFWNKEWADKYEQLSDVAENVYNKVLDKDLNYTPDKFVKLSIDTDNVELSNSESAFFNNNDGVIYKKETGVLMTAVRPEKLPINTESGETNMYIDLSFDKNNANAMYDALIDMGTAAPIRQIEAFLNSPDFRKIVPKSEDARILKNRVQLYVGNIRNKNLYSNDELSAAIRSLNKIASIGVGQALGGVLQPFKQVIPVAMNTLVNTGGLDMGAMFNAAKNGFINRSGYAISNRGIESQAQVESLNRLIDEASKSKGAELLKKVEKLNKWWLDKFLVNPDVFIARASWMTYYDQSLKKQGIDTKGIDYNTHEVNEQAADYAQRMVDRQQNVSDADLSGKLFSNKEPSNQFLVKTLLPFASFRMNQSARLGSDLAVLADKTATKEDKKIAIRSLSGFTVEMVTFRMVSAGATILLGSAAKLLLGQDEDDEEYNKRVNNIIKGQVTSAFTDIMSPLPILDKAYQKGGNFLTESMLGIPRESVFSIYNVPKQDYLQSLGLFGIAADRALQLYNISNLSATGQYTDDFGKVKQISESDRQVLKYLIAPAILSNVGLAPVEANSIVRNAIKYAKKGEGKSSEDVATKQERASKKQADNYQKLEALETLQGKTTNQDELDAIDQKIYELTASPDDKKSLEQSRKVEKEQKEYLLTDFDSGKTYDNETDLKRYNPTLYNKNFGPQSEWYQEHKAEKSVDKKLNKETRKLEDIEEGYRKY